MTMDIAAQRALIAEKIANGEVIRIEMGTAYDRDMKEVPWRATVIPIKFTASAKGERLRCRVDTGNAYLAFTAEQSDGIKHLLLGSFEVIG